jgi:hypothetical protein
MEKIHHERKSGPNRVHVPGRNLHSPSLRRQDRLHPCLR